MKAGYRNLSFIALTAAPLAPGAIATRAVAQDDKRQEDHERHDKKQTGVYDRSHKDYHDWNENEDKSYRQYAVLQVRWPLRAHAPPLVPADVQISELPHCDP